MKLVVVVCAYFTYANSFNIDTKFPIVYEVPDKSQHNTYFGYSVILHKHWVQVGAPRSNSSILGQTVKEPGVAYRCKVTGPCLEVTLDTTKNEKQETGEVWYLKDYAWIGGAMDIEEGENGRVVVCGHRWKNQWDERYNSRGYYINGLCYWAYTAYDINTKSRTLIPTAKYPKNFAYSRKDLFKRSYSESQVGISVHLFPTDRDEPGLLIGAPGALNGRGTIVEYSGNLTRKTNPVRRRSTKTEFGSGNILSEYPSILRSFDLFGYSVSSGCFFDKNRKNCHYVGSSPRGLSLTGYVLVFNVSSPSKVEKIDVRQGLKMGEYFGSSLAVADFNGDGFDDLVVGAPLYSLQSDEGRIHIFLGSEKEKLMEPRNYMIVGSKIGGRFGHTIASLGDIDKDGFMDIAVAAPYEGSGVVYIYNGSPEGLQVKYSQKIVAEEIHPKIRGLGISIARPEDIDKNNYADVAIGAYLSEHAVLLRSYPVVILEGNLSRNESNLKLSQTEFDVNVCIMYSGQKVPSHLYVVQSLRVDAHFQRCSPKEDETEVLLRHQEPHCETRNFKIKPNDRVDDIVVELSQRLKVNVSEAAQNVIWINSLSFNTSFGDDKFCASCPVVKRSEDFVLKIPYARECGEDGTCKSDLQLSCRIRDTGLEYKYVIGSSSRIQLFVQVNNTGDPAYASFIQVRVPQEVNLALVPSNCQEIVKNSFLYVTCNFGVIRHGSSRNVTLSFDMSSTDKLLELSENNEYLQFFVSSNSSSVEIKGNDNVCTTNINILAEGELNLFGKSQEAEYYIHLSSELDDASQEEEFAHIYEVQKIGPSPINEFSVSLLIPVRYVESDIPFNTWSIVLPEEPEKSVVCVSKIHKYSYYEKNSDEIPAVGFTNLYIRPNRTFYINCTSENVICDQMYCEFKDSLQSKTEKMILKMKLNLAVLEPLLGMKDIIFFSTHGTVNILKPRNIQASSRNMSDSIIVSSPFIGSPPKEKVQLWIIIVCIIAGIVLILLIVTGLIKGGFFKRQIREELQALKGSNPE